MILLFVLVLLAVEMPVPRDGAAVINPDPVARRKLDEAFFSVVAVPLSAPNAAAFWEPDEDTI